LLALTLFFLFSSSFSRRILIVAIHGRGAAFSKIKFRMGGIFGIISQVPLEVLATLPSAGAFHFTLELAVQPFVVVGHHINRTPPQSGRFTLFRVLVNDLAKMSDLFAFPHGCHPVRQSHVVDENCVDQRPAARRRHYAPQRFGAQVGALVE
jgi:hypothetical protein